MKSQRRRTTGLASGSASLRRDDGVSIIEVLTAALIFLMLSVLVAQATVTAIRLGGDQKHRVTALSLAASEIDKVRAIGDPFDIRMGDVTTNVTIDETRYKVIRKTSWVNSTGLDIPCGAGGTGKLQYKRINVRVEWAGQMAPRTPVSSDTIIAPDGRINDPTRGTIMVAAIRADGSGAAGVSATITPVSGGAVALDTQPAATNTEGCTFALQVKPGVYSVTLAKTGYISSDQVTSPSQQVTVKEGDTVKAPFSFDAAAALSVGYAGSTSGLRFASNNELTLVSTYGLNYLKPAQVTEKLFPHRAGYTVFAGHYVAPDPDGTGGCPAVDPSAWRPATVGGTQLGAGVAPSAVVTEPAGASAVVVPIGIVRIDNIPKNRWVTAVSQSGSVAGQPGCAVEMRYTFDRESNTDSSNGSRLLALPYGSWRISYGTSLGATTTAVPTAQIVPQTNVVTTGMVTGSVVTLDPRRAP